MGLDAVVRSALLAADATATIQGTLTHEAWIGQDQHGAPLYAPPVSHLALIHQGTNQHRTLTGEVITTRACVSFLRPIAPNGTAGRREPVDPRDRITLFSGMTGPLVEAPGSMIDPATGAPFLSVFWLR